MMNVRSYDNVLEPEVKSVRFRSDAHLAATPTSANRNHGADDSYEEKLTPSPTGYRDYTPPPELVQNRYKTSGSSPRRQHDGDYKSNHFYTTVGDNEAKNKDETFTHKTILLGDSGVGKTSLLVQFDTGQFQTGNFAATVGIGFTILRLSEPSDNEVEVLDMFVGSGTPPFSALLLPGVTDTEVKAIAISTNPDPELALRRLERVVFISPKFEKFGQELQTLPDVIKI